MAVFKSPLIAAMSGSMAGITATSGQTGKVLRRRAIPTNPNSFRQVSMRRQFGRYATIFRDKLTAAQRDRWETFAKTVTRTNALGDEITLTGVQAFIAYHGILSSTLGDVIFTTPSPQASGRLRAGNYRFNLSTATTISLFVDEAPPWSVNTNGRCSLMISEPVSAARRPTGLRYQWWTNAVGSNVPPPGNAFAFSRAAQSRAPDLRTGQRYFVKLKSVTFDTGQVGMTSQTITIGPIFGPP